MSKKPVPHDPETGEVHEPLGSQPYLRSFGYRPTYLDDNGHEVLDPTPMAPPVGYRPQPTMVDHIRAQIRSAKLAEEAELAGLETFEEADDFDVDDDFDPSSPYEEMFDPAPPSRRFETAQELLNLRPDRPERPKAPQTPRNDPPAVDKAPATPKEPSSVKAAEGAREGLDGPNAQK